MAAYDDSWQNQTQRNADKLKMAQYVAKMQAEQQAARDEQEAMIALANMSTSPASVSGPMAQFQQPGGASALMSGAMGGQMPPATQLATQMAAPPDDPAAQKMAQANAMMALFARTKKPAHFAMAQKFEAEATKLRDENQGFETVIGPDGKLKLVQRRRFGAPQEMPYAPKPDIKTVNANDRTEFYDALRPPSSPIQHGLSPDTRFTGGITMRGQNMTDARAREAATGGGKPQWDGAAGMFVYPPSAESPTGRVAQPEGYNRISKPLTESQAKNALYLGMMKTASEGINQITGLSNSEIALARGDVTAVPQFMQNIMAGDTAQKYIQGSLQWTEAMLRITTGATAPPEELRRVSKTFFPQIGDGADVVAQKAARRAQMEQFVAIGSGKGAGQVDEVLANKGTSEAEYARLPSGATYTAPDGTTRRKR
jgi:hypothetical protein